MKKLSADPCRRRFWSHYKKARRVRHFRSWLLMASARSSLHPPQPPPLRCMCQKKSIFLPAACRNQVRCSALAILCAPVKSQKWIRERDFFFRGADKLAHPDYTIPSAPLSFREHFDEPSLGTHPLLWQKRIPPEQSTTREMDLWCLFCSFLAKSPLHLWESNYIHPGEIMCCWGIGKGCLAMGDINMCKFRVWLPAESWMLANALEKFLCLVHEAPNNTKHFFQGSDACWWNFFGSKPYR